MGVQGILKAATLDMADYVQCEEDGDCPKALHNLMFFKRISPDGAINRRSRFKTTGEDGLVRSDIACALYSMLRYVPEEKALFISASPAGMLERSMAQNSLVLDPMALGLQVLQGVKELDVDYELFRSVDTEELSSNLAFADLRDMTWGD